MNDESQKGSDQEISFVFMKMKADEASRYQRLNHLLKSQFEKTKAYPGTTKEKRRAEIAQEIVDELQIAPPNRLLSLITQALRFQQLQGALPEGQQYDLFREISPENLLPELFPTRMHGQIKFGKKSFPSCASFSPDGQFLVTGSVDGFLEVWNFSTCKLRKDLPYQATDNFMLHRTSVLCLTFSVDSNLIASGDKEGTIKVWNIRKGNCIQKFTKVHQKSITALKFSKQSNKILSSSQDESVRIHGRQSGRTLCTMRGHTSFVNDCCWSEDEETVVSCSSDGTVKVWNATQGDCLFSFRPDSGPANEVTINSVHINPLSNNLVVCSRSKKIGFYSFNGKVSLFASN